MAYNAPTCRRCGARIQWRKTPAGKWMPLDEGVVEIELDPQGKTTVVDDQGKVLRGNKSQTPNAWGRVPHWSTCPNANEFRRAKA